MRFLGIVMALVLAASPLYGAVCTMTCADDAASCCCRNAAGGEELSLTKPSCCPLEVEAANSGVALLERTTVTQSPLSPVYQFAEAPRNQIFANGDSGENFGFPGPGAGACPLIRDFSPEFSLADLILPLRRPSPVGMPVFFSKHHQIVRPPTCDAE